MITLEQAKENIPALDIALAKLAQERDTPMNEFISTLRGFEITFEQSIVPECRIYADKLIQQGFVVDYTALARRCWFMLQDRMLETGFIKRLDFESGEVVKPFILDSEKFKSGDILKLYWEETKQHYIQVLGF